MWRNPKPRPPDTARRAPSPAGSIAAGGVAIRWPISRGARRRVTAGLSSACIRANRRAPRFAVEADKRLTTLWSIRCTRSIRSRQGADAVHQSRSGFGRLAPGISQWSRSDGRWRAAPGPADGSDLAAASASAEELIAAIGLESRHACSRRHLEFLEGLSRCRIESPQIALVTFPGAVPKLAVDPGDPGDDAVGLDGAKDRPCLRIDLMDLAAPILPHPERSFGPCEPRIAAAAGRRDRREHTAGVRIDLVDAILGDLKQMLAVERRSRMRGDIDRAQRLSARGIEGVQLFSAGKPDVLTVKRHPIDAVGARKGAVFTEDFGAECFMCRSFPMLRISSRSAADRGVTRLS